MTIIVNTASPSTPRALMAAEIWTPLTNAPFDHIEPRPTQLARKSAGDLDGTTERVPGDYGLLRSDRGRDPLEHAAAIDGETWAQSITVWYERARGLRLKHQQADDFTFYASRTISVPVEVLFDAFVNTRSRRKWLTDGTMSLRTSQAGHTARFDWGDGSTRVSVSFLAKGPAKASVAVAHERLPDADEAEMAKASWRGRLAALKSELES